MSEPGGEGDGGAAPPGRVRYSCSPMETAGEDVARAEVAVGGGPPLA
ncbi:hypothetical protein ABTX81_35365 [Kitasatospora sp. NPDC097605]